MPDIKPPKTKKNSLASLDVPAEPVAKQPEKKFSLRAEEPEMDEDMEMTPEKTAPAPASKPVFQSKVTEAKPSLEGINVPYSKPAAVVPNLTEAEKKLAREPFFPEKSDKKIFDNPPKMAEGKSYSWAWVLVFLLFFGLAGYFFWQQGFRVKIENISGNEEFKQVDNTTEDTFEFKEVATPEQEQTEPTPTPTPTPSAVVSQKQVKISSTPTGFLNVRSGAGSNFEIITKVSPGEVYEYTETSGEWYKLVLKDGKAGWVSGQYAVKVTQ